MGIVEAECRVQELSAMVKAQLRLIRKLDERGKDLTSAKIVCDSLRVSLFLATQALHRTRRQDQSDEARTNVSNELTRTHVNDTLLVWKENPVLVDASKKTFQDYITKTIGEEPVMKVADDVLDLTDKVGAENAPEHVDASIVPATELEQKAAPPAADFEFQPLTEDEKKDFVNSLNAEGKRIMAQLSEKVVRSGESAAYCPRSVHT